MQVEANHKGTEEGSWQVPGCQRTQQTYSGKAPATMAFGRETVNFQFSPSCLQIPVLLEQF